MGDDHIRLINSPSGGDFAGITFKQAKFYRLGRRGYQPCWIVLHCAECSETFTAAEALQAYAYTMSDNRQASWTFAVDADSVTQSVKLKDTAWHAPPLNDMSIGIELAGWTKQVDSDWADSFSARMLQQQLVPLLAKISKATGIPLKTVDDGALRLALPTCTELVQRKADGDEWLGFKSHSGGIVTHAQVSRVFRKSDHYDPGKAFPLDDVVRRAQLAFTALG